MELECLVGKVKKIILTIVVLTLFLICGPANSVTYTKVQGKIADVYLFSDDWETYNTQDTGIAAIYMTPSSGWELLPGCGTGQRRILISTDHPLFNSVVSTVLTAKVTGQTVELWHLTKCTIRTNAWDFGVIRVLK